MNAAAASMNGVHSRGLLANVSPIRHFKHFHCVRSHAMIMPLLATGDRNR
jgi:hypothetical protein